VRPTIANCIDFLCDDRWNNSLRRENIKARAYQRWKGNVSATSYQDGFHIIMPVSDATIYESLVQFLMAMPLTTENIIRALTMASLAGLLLAVGLRLTARQVIRALKECRFALIPIALQNQNTIVELWCY
jgi:hypothetical protein